MENLRQVIPHSPPEMVIPVNVNEILRDVLDICTPRLLSAGVVVDWSPAATLPPILGRPLQLRMLFKALVDGGHKRATLILKKQVKQLHLLAEALLEYETLTGDEITELLDKGKLDRPEHPGGTLPPAPVRGSAVPKAGRRFSDSNAKPLEA